MIAYDSPEFWSAVCGRWAAIDENGNVCLYEQEPQLCERVWWAPGSLWLDCRGLNLDPSSLPPWRESLRRRPHVWRPPDKTTPHMARVFCRYAKQGQWSRRHYAGNDSVYPAGTTDWTCESSVPAYVEQIVLADPDDPTLVPPEDWQPTTS